MKFLKIIESILNFLIQLPKETTKAIDIYQKQLSRANGDKVNIDMAKNTLLYFFLKNWLINILVPLAVIILTISLAVKYFIPILAVGFIYYLVWCDFKEKNRGNVIQQQQEIEFMYYEISKFIFNPLRQMDECLDVKVLQGLTDISIHPSYNIESRVAKLHFKLLKKSSEPIENDKILFSEKMLQSLITSKLHKKQILENRTFFYDDVPCLVVDYITDFGDYIQITIVYVNSESSYNYVKEKACYSTTSKMK
ncbi:hypothetical protein [Bacillus sp. Hm123]|uniref:hypothetical protein n=1 Tax=Bacillus sp. Hm123 TaxID=3450745 RepID=UPI003F41FDA3